MNLLITDSRICRGNLGLQSLQKRTVMPETQGWHQTFLPSADIWLLRLDVNPDILWCRLFLLLLVLSHIPGIIFKWFRQLALQWPRFLTMVIMLKADLKHPVSDLPLLSRNELGVSELCHSLAPQLEHSESFWPFQLFVAHKVKLLLQMFQTEVVWSGDLSTSGHLTNHRTNTSCLGECGSSSSSCVRHEEVWYPL